MDVLKISEDRAMMELTDEELSDLKAEKRRLKTLAIMRRTGYPRRRAAAPLPSPFVTPDAPETTDDAADSHTARRRIGNSGCRGPWYGATRPGAARQYRRLPDRRPPRLSRYADGQWLRRDHQRHLEWEKGVSGPGTLWGDLFRVRRGDGEAAARLANKGFKRPLPIQRWERYRVRLIAACQERAANDAIHTDGSWWTVLHRVTAEAIRLTAIELNGPRASIAVTVDGKRWTVREDRDITPWEILGELPLEFFFNWFRINVANGVMDNLLPNWRSEEQRSRQKLQFTSLDTLISRVARQFGEGRNNEKRTGFYDALIAQDATTKGGHDAIVAQESAAAFIDRLLPLLTPRECLVLEAYGNGSHTRESIAQSLGKDRSTVSRQITSIANKARRLSEADAKALDRKEAAMSA